jgi:hypothetical protein
MPAGSLLCTHLPLEGLLGPFEERVIFLDLVVTMEGVVELQASFLSEIRWTLYNVWSRRAVPLGGGSTHWGISFSPSLFYPKSAFWSV